MEWLIKIVIRWSEAGLVSIHTTGKPKRADIHKFDKHVREAVTTKCSLFTSNWAQIRMLKCLLLFGNQWFPVIRSQCATTEAMALIANLNLNYFRRFTHNDNHFTCVPSVVHELVQRIGHRWMQVIHYIEYLIMYSITYMYVIEYIVM